MIPSQVYLVIHSPILNNNVHHYQCNSTMPGPCVRKVNQVVRLRSTLQTAQTDLIIPFFVSCLHLPLIISQWMSYNTFASSIPHLKTYKHGSLYTTLQKRTSASDNLRTIRIHTLPDAIPSIGMRCTHKTQTAVKSVSDVVCISSYVTYWFSLHISLRGINSSLLVY